MSYDPHQQPQPPYTAGQQPLYPPPGPGIPYGAPPPMYPVQPPPKKTSPLKVVLITIGVVLAVCVGGSVIAAVAGGDDDHPKTSVAADPTRADTKEPVDKPTTPAEDANGDFDVKLGTKVTVTGDDTSQNVTVKSFKTHKKACNQFLPEPDNGMFVVVDVLVESTKGAVSVNPLSFKWVGADGTTSNSLDGAFSGCAKNNLDAADVRAGQKRAGQIVFDVASAKGAVEFSPGAFSEAVASWKIG